MRNRLLTAVICSSVLLISGCQTKSPPASDRSKSPDQQQSKAAQAPTAPSNTPTTPAASSDATPAKSPTSQPAQPEAQARQSKPQSAAKPASPQAQQPSGEPQAKMPARPILLTGAPMGGVKFEHAKHSFACDTCHHASREPKPNSEPQQACTSCHTKPPQPGMKTGKQAAFHNPTATAGTCIDCHKKSGDPAPTKCTQCHKRENA